MEGGHWLNPEGPGALQPTVPAFPAASPVVVAKLLHGLGPQESVCCLSEILKQVLKSHSRDAVPFFVGYKEPYFPNELVAKELSITDGNEEARNQ